ncbi:ABC transporter substrate-binding protein [Tardiphaga sp.]|jgi:ABC-type branched-subunit amino acid transport system substrate-binding protein|uniref:ABC transporter substrate-binding protein n=1 Tax=Tardiphaga sp. TaxID=1926292 RepID=UPI0037DA6BAC
MRLADAVQLPATCLEMTVPTISLPRRSLLAASVAMVAAFASPSIGLAQDGPVRIGLLAPLTGTGGPYGQEEEQAARAAVKIINDAGGVLGRKLELVVADDESQPTAGVAAARKLIDVDKVVSIGGVWSSAVALAIKPIALEKGVLLSTVGSADEITDGDNKNLVWRFQTNGKSWGEGFAKAMVKDGVKSASILVLQTPFTLSTIQPFRKAFTDAGGKVLDEVNFNAGQPSYRTEVERIFAKKPDAVFVAAYINELSAIAKEAFRSGYESKIYAFGNAAGSNGQFVKNVGANVAEGVVWTQQVPVGKSVSYSRYLKEIGKPEGTIMTFGAQVFDQIVLTALAIEKAKSTDATKFGGEFPSLVNSDGPSLGDPAEALNALRDGKPFRYAGAASDFKFAKNGDQTNLSYGHFVIKSGESKLLGEIR